MHSCSLRSVFQCSKTCGFGRKHRPVTCRNRQGVEVSSHLCDVQTKPKTRRRCAEFPCPYIWNTGPWSPVSRGPLTTPLLYSVSLCLCLCLPLSLTVEGGNLTVEIGNLTVEGQKLDSGGWKPDSGMWKPDSGGGNLTVEGG